MRTVLSAALAATMITPVAAAAQEEIKIGAVYMDAQGFYAGVRKGIRDAASEADRDLDIIETNAQGDVSKESSFIDSLISANVDAIIVSPVSADGSYRAIERANRAGIPVVCYNTCLSEDDQEAFVTAYAVGDPYEFGAMLGTAAADYFEEQGIEAPKIAVLNCEFVEVCITRREGFEAALGDRLPDYEIVANQEGATLDNAVSVASTMLSSLTDLDAIFGEAGGATLGAARAVRSQGRVGDVVVFGGDMTTEIAQALQDHDIIKAVVDISGQDMGRLAFAEAVSASQGETDGEIKTPATIEIYATPESATEWLETHPDGIP